MRILDVMTLLLIVIITMAIILRHLALLAHIHVRRLSLRVGEGGLQDLLAEDGDGGRGGGSGHKKVAAAASHHNDRQHAQQADIECDFLLIR